MANMPMRVIVLDANTEGGDPSFITIVDGEKFYITDAKLADQADLAPDYLADVIRQLDAT
ncbi:MAG: hypothetical protein KJ558_10185 [Gammaproteobacteria bacterium]|nr:hypothetical protein [Gammaproteobacteria bacterium]MBU1655175.1 hypothetical protein [Gammaproteobacteria bacterium]MBU1959986.1 hypothetical protein [Gammaproteobacteria bacterium]